MRYPGGLIASSPVNAAYPSGVWTQAQTQPYAAQNVWMRDQFWPNTTLLLQGNGTNGAQNNTFLDSSTNNFTITRNGNVTQGSFTPYEANGYWSNSSFSSSAYLTYNPGATAAFGTGDFTVEAWVFATAALSSGDNPYICDTRGGGGAWSLSWNYNGTANPWQLAWANSSVLQSSTSMTLNTWNHCAYVRSGTTGTLYLNGVSIGTWTDSYNYSASVTSLRIGSRYATTGITDWLPGYLSNLRIVKGTAVYTGAFTPPTAPLTAVTNTVLLTCQSNRFIDNSSNAFAITVNGTPSVQAFQPFPGATTWSGSVLGGSGYFDGTGDYLNGSSSTGATNFGTGDFTTECWVYFTTVASQSNFIDNLGNSTYTLYIAPGGQLRFFNGADRIIGATLTAGQWYHIALVRSSGVTRLWLNGAQTGSNYTDGNNYAGGSTFPFIGAAFNASTFHTGYMADVRCVKSAVYTSAFTPPSAPLTAITNTSLLLNFTNGGIFDSAMMNNLETVGNAQVSTSVVKYGTGSMAFDGTGDYLVVRAATNNLFAFGTGDFTIEFWLYLNATTQQIIWDGRPGSTTPTIYYFNSALRYYTNAADQIVGSALNTGQWYHIAICRSGTSTRMFINGTQSGSTYSDSTNYTTSTPIISADANSGSYNLNLNGYIDDLRITKGAARYIGNFTPPVARMPQQ